MRQAAPDDRALAEARSRVEQARAANRASRDHLAQAMLEQDVEHAYGDADLSSQVRHLAHQLWERAGRPVGKAEEHWYLAEQLVQNAPLITPLASRRVA